MLSSEAGPGKKKMPKSPLAAPTAAGRDKKKRLNASSSNLYRSYYPHPSRELVSPLFGIFYVINQIRNVEMGTTEKKYEEEKNITHTVIFWDLV